MKSNKVYKGLISECERLEHEGVYKGNGHHLAQRLTVSVLIELLPTKQRAIYDKMTNVFQTAKEIADKAKIHTKEISPNVAQINSRGILVTTKKVGGIVKYKKAYE